jgi:O-acetyl-ADP-ribose deacetylase (regulator of RNase III)
MGAGIAKEIKERIPEACEADQKTLRGDIKKLGNFVGVRVNGIIVLNCYTQFRYGKNHEDGNKKPVDYEAITLCLRKINHILPGKSIGLPLIGCGLAGGDWTIVEKIIEKELKDMVVTIVRL